MENNDDCGTEGSIDVDESLPLPLGQSSMERGRDEKRSYPLNAPVEDSNIDLKQSLGQLEESSLRLQQVFSASELGETEEPNRPDYANIRGSPKESPNPRRNQSITVPGHLKENASPQAFRKESPMQQQFHVASNAAAAVAVDMSVFEDETSQEKALRLMAEEMAGLKIQAEYAVAEANARVEDEVRRRLEEYRLNIESGARRIAEDSKAVAQELADKLNSEMQRNAKLSTHNQSLESRCKRLDLIVRELRDANCEMASEIEGLTTALEKSSQSNSEFMKEATWERSRLNAISTKCADALWRRRACARFVQLWCRNAQHMKRNAHKLNKARRLLSRHVLTRWKACVQRCLVLRKCGKIASRKRLRRGWIRWMTSFCGWLGARRRVVLLWKWRIHRFLKKWLHQTMKGKMRREHSRLVCELTRSRESSALDYSLKLESLETMHRNVSGDLLASELKVTELLEEVDLLKKRLFEKESLESEVIRLKDDCDALRRNQERSRLESWDMEQQVAVVGEIEKKMVEAELEAERCKALNIVQERTIVELRDKLAIQRELVEEERDRADNFSRSIKSQGARIKSFESKKLKEEGMMEDMRSEIEELRRELKKKEANEELVKQEVSLGYRKIVADSQAQVAALREELARAKGSEREKETYKKLVEEMRKDRGLEPIRNFHSSPLATTSTGICGMPLSRSVASLKEENTRRFERLMGTSTPVTPSVIGEQISLMQMDINDTIGSLTNKDKP